MEKMEFEIYLSVRAHGMMMTGHGVGSVVVVVIVHADVTVIRSRVGSSGRSCSVATGRSHAVTSSRTRIRWWITGRHHAHRRHAVHRTRRWKRAHRAAHGRADRWTRSSHLRSSRQSVGSGPLRRRNVKIVSTPKVGVASVAVTAAYTHTTDSAAGRGVRRDIHHSGHHSSVSARQSAGS